MALCYSNSDPDFVFQNEEKNVVATDHTEGNRSDRHCQGDGMSVWDIGGHDVLNCRFFQESLTQGSGGKEVWTEKLMLSFKTRHN